MLPIYFQRASFLALMARHYTPWTEEFNSAILRLEQHDLMHRDLYTPIKGEDLFERRTVKEDLEPFGLTVANF